MMKLQNILYTLTIIIGLTHVSSFTVSIPGTQPTGILPDAYNCNSPDGGVSPPIQLTDAPANTVTFALIMYNYQKDGGGNMVSSGDDWGVYNIPPKTTLIPANNSNRARSILGLAASAWQNGHDKEFFQYWWYKPPCSGDCSPKTYTFTVYALNTTLKNSYHTLSTYNLSLIVPRYTIASASVSATSIRNLGCTKTPTTSPTTSQFVNISPCNGQNGTCSPNWCVRVSNPTCANPNANLVVNKQSFVNSVGCRVCKQSSSAKCKASYFNSVLKTGNGLTALYCNDKWLVMSSVGVPNHLSDLQNIPQPPGGTDLQYAKSCVARSYNEQYLYFKFPLNPQLLPSSSLSNNLKAFKNQKDPEGMNNTDTGYAIGLPVSGPVAVSVSGVPIFPLFNNRVLNSYEECEVGHCNAHAGKGNDYHYHGDPFHPVTGTCMYSPSDYFTDLTHPPLIGWSFDGLEVYGRYIYPKSLGFSVPLDVCGGHVHNDKNGVAMTYHYHSQVLNGTATKDNVIGASAIGKPYTFNVGGVYQCWRGNISISNFFNLNGPFLQRKDLDQLKPCCNSSEYYVTSGITLPITSAAISGGSPSASPSSNNRMFCGDGICDSSESPATCSKDCSALNSVSPSILTTSVPVTTMPTTIFKPTTSPAQKISLAPATIVSNFISFQTALTLDGATTSTLDSASEQAIITATAQSMDIYSQYVTILKSPSKKRLSAVSVTVNLQIQYPIVDNTISSSTIYTQLTNNLKVSQATGTFNNNLQTASTSLGAQVIKGSTISSVKFSTLTTITGTTKPSLSPSVASNPSSSDSGLSMGVIIAIAVGGGILFICMLFFIFRYFLSNSKEAIVRAESERIPPASPIMEETYPQTNYKGYGDRNEVGYARPVERSSGKSGRSGGRSSGNNSRR